MTSSVLWTGFRDSTPANTFPNAGSLKEFVAIPTPTPAGSIIAAAATNSNPAGTQITGFQDSLGNSFGSALEINITTGNSYTAMFGLVTPTDLPVGQLATATAGTTTTSIVVAGAGWSTNQWQGATVTDYANHTASVTSNTSTTLTLGSAISGMTSGSDFLVGGYIQMNISAFEDYVGVVVSAISGASSILNSSHNRQAGAGAGTDTLTSGTKALGSSPVGIWSFSFDDSSSNLPFAPGIGSGQTNLGTSWIWDTAGPGIRVQFRNVANPGTTGATFSPAATNDYNTFMFAVLDSAPPDILMGAICL
jgi:hypothetical protein